MWQKNFHFHSLSLLASQGSDQGRCKAGAFRDSQLNPSTQPNKLHVSTKDHPQKYLLYSKIKVCEMKRICNKIWKFSWFLNSQEFLEISRKFSRNFTSRSRSRGIFNSLFTLDLDFETFSFHFSLSISISTHFHFTFHSRNEWTRFPFHFSLLELPISTLAGPWCRHKTSVSRGVIRHFLALPIQFYKKKQICHEFLKIMNRYFPISNIHLDTIQKQIWCVNLGKNWKRCVLSFEKSEGGEVEVECSFWME